jgi:hypothetical protein
VKVLDALWLARCAAWVRDASRHDRRLAGLLGADAVLVPVPGSARTGDVPWVALQLALALRGAGFGLCVWAGLHRAVAVRKSATAAARPQVREHYDSLAIIESAPPGRLVLIDDVITKGRTLLAAAARLEAQMPSADIGAFALFRTRGALQRLDRLGEVCHGTIRWAGGDARREP